MILQILNILIPLIRKFLSLKAIQTNQNYWNESSIALANKRKFQGKRYSVRFRTYPFSEILSFVCQFRILISPRNTDGDT